VSAPAQSLENRNRRLNMLPANFSRETFRAASSDSIRSFRNFFLTSIPFTRKTALASCMWRNSLLRGENGSRSDCANRHKRETPGRPYGVNVSSGARRAPRFYFSFLVPGIILRRRRWPPRLARAPDKWTRNRSTCTNSPAWPENFPRECRRRLPEFPREPC